MTSQTIAGAQPYWDRYYAASFTFGCGTEDILTMLAGLPPAAVWLDLGAGSESLLWSTPVRGHEKVPVCGRVEVSAGGQLKVPIPRSSCRPGG